MDLKELLLYKVFKSTEEFANWQIEKERKIQSIIPLLGNIEGNANIENNTIGNTSIELTGKISVFVVYWDTLYE
jgi:hypothetical protein